MYSTSLPPRPNPYARISESYAPQFSPEELPLLPANWIPSWRTPPRKIWGDIAGKATIDGGIELPSTSPARPKTTGSVRFARDSSARKIWESLRENCTRRLHASQTHNISERSIESGLIPRHLLDGTIPPLIEKTCSSLDFFPPCERPVTAAPIRMGHQFRLARAPPAGHLDAYKKGKVLRDDPVRIVRHTSKDRTYMKKSDLRNPRGISRNVLGGFCTS